MIATNFKKNPDALITQRELELCFAATENMTEKAFEIIEKTFLASGVWLKSYMMKIEKVINVPAWFSAMRKRAIALSNVVKKAIISIF